MSEATQVADGATTQQAEASVEERLGALLGSEEPEQEQEQSEEQEAQSDDVADEQEVTDEAEVDEPSEEENAEEEEAAPELETVQIGEETYEVPPAVAKAVMRHSEFMRRQQGVEAREREVEQLQKIAQQKVAVYSQMEDVVGDIRNLNLIIKNAEQTTNWEWLRANDPIEYNAKQLEIIQAKDQLKGLVEHKSRAEAQINEAEQAYKATLTAEGHKVLSTKIKGWGPQLANNLTKYAVSLGFSEQQVAEVINPLNVMLLHKAYQYDQSRKTANSKVNLEGKRIPPTTPSMRPGSTPNKANVAQMKRHNEDRARLRRTGSLEDAARLINIS